jgi:hypothetical protein
MRSSPPSITTKQPSVTHANSGPNLSLLPVSDIGKKGVVGSGGDNGHDVFGGCKTFWW